MCKKVFVVGCLVASILINSQSVYAKYNASDARVYAMKYALNYNSAYPIPNKKADCTNYVSQCVKAGGAGTYSIPDNKVKYRDLGDTYECKTYWDCREYQRNSPIGVPTKRFVWTSTWTTVASTEDWYGFYEYFKNARGLSTEEYNCSKSARLDAICKNAAIGDIIQVRENNSSRRSHSMIVTNKVYNSSTRKYDLHLCYHSNDHLNVSMRSFVYPGFSKAGSDYFTLIKMTQL